MVLYSQAAIALHNYLRTAESSVYCPPGFIDGEDGAGNIFDGGWRGDEDPCGGLVSVAHAGSNRFVPYCNLMLISIICTPNVSVQTFQNCCCHKRCFQRFLQ